MRDFLGDKADQYIYAASYVGIADGQDGYVLGRVPKKRMLNLNASDWTFQKSDGTWTSDPDGAAPVNNTVPLGPDNNSLGLGPDLANWKTMNSYSVDGVLYMFVTRCLYPWVSGDLEGRHVFENSSVIKSTDGGKTWTRSGQANYGEPMFPGKRFGAPYFVWYGKDGKSSVDNGDNYVYAVSNNGYFENGDNYVLGRVSRRKLPDLNPVDWSFYKGGDGMKDSNWTANIDVTSPILVAPKKSSITGMTYIAGLQRYVMALWHYPSHSFFKAMKVGDFSTVIEFFEAPEPWGPWTRIKSFDTGNLGWYAPIIGQRFQTVVDSATVKGFLYASGLPSDEAASYKYRLYYMPITLSTKPLPHNNPAFVGGR